jgi:putative hydrolase of the HAD superfamily
MEESASFNITRTHNLRVFQGGRLALRAVVFDYGIVLTGPPDSKAHAALLRITGLPLERFESLYWADRQAYDEGKLTGITYWQEFLREAGLPEDPKMIEELNHWDARLWTVQNPVMVAWQLQLKQHGLRTAILSNIGDRVLASVQREFDWIHRFDVQIWSYQLGMAKPNPAIYRHALTKLGTQPEETLFIDDKRINVEAARALGIQTIEFASVERLRADLIAAGLDRVLPLPG